MSTRTTRSSGPAETDFETMPQKTGVVSRHDFENAKREKNDVIKQLEKITKENSDAKKKMMDEIQSLQKEKQDMYNESEAAKATFSKELEEAKKQIEAEKAALKESLTGDINKWKDKFHNIRIKSKERKAEILLLNEKVEKLTDEKNNIEDTLRATDKKLKDCRYFAKKKKFNLYEQISTLKDNRLNEAYKERGITPPIPVRDNYRNRQGLSRNNFLNNRSFQRSQDFNNNRARSQGSFRNNSARSNSQEDSFNRRHQNTSDRRR